MGLLNHIATRSCSKGLVLIQMLPVLRPDFGSAFWCNLNELSCKIASDGLDFNDEDVFATNSGVVDAARRGFVGLERNEFNQSI